MIKQPVDVCGIMYDSILVPTDGSETIDGTLEHAIRMASDTGATIQALYVVDTRVIHATSGELRDDLATDLAEQGETAVGAVADRVVEAGLDAETSVRKGTPDKEIISYANEHGTDVIVIGTHGKTPREKLQSLGSVSERVVDTAEMPVFVIKNAADA